MSLTRIGRPSCDRSADHTLTDLEAKRAHHIVRIADGIGDASSCLVVEQVDRERAEARESRNELRNLREQIVEVEHRRDLTSELEQRREQLGVGRRRGGAA